MLLKQSLYVFATSTADGHRSPVKIGVTNNVPGRLRSVRTGSPAPIVLAYAFPPLPQKLARLFEQETHKTFAQARLHGEWFALDPDIAVNALATLIQGHFRIPFRGDDKQREQFGIAGADAYCLQQDPSFFGAEEVQL